MKTKTATKIKYIDIFDIDGVLLDSSHRYRTITTKKGERIDLNHWRENEHLCLNDSRLPTALQYDKSLMSQNRFVIIATSRILRAKDYQAIENLLGMPDSIVGRSHNKQKGHNLKISGIQRIIQDCNLQHVKNENMTVYEDNITYLKGICDFFKCKGIYIPSTQGH